jgi:GTP cyclohydrolase I
MMLEADKTSSLQRLVGSLLTAIGEDPARDGLVDTPSRVAESLAFLTQGTNQSLAEIVGEGVLDGPYDEMVVVRDVELYSLCEHHMLPFFGHCHVAFIPDGKVLGLSKVARIVDYFARRLQIQERLTTQIANCIEELLTPKGVAIVVEAQHFCMMMRGVEKQSSVAKTSCMLGLFRSNAETRAELLALLQRGG